MSQDPLDHVRIATPCPASWDSMEGDDRVRFCGSCRLNVYNLSGMTRREATELLKLVEGRLCIRLLRRKDGTVLTQDCPARASWVGVISRAASFLLAASVPFWGTMILVHWRDIQAAITPRMRARPEAQVSPSTAPAPVQESRGDLGETEGMPDYRQYPMDGDRMMGLYIGPR